MVTQTTSFAIAMVDPVLGKYFEGFNNEDYERVAALFDAEGVLSPPFEEGILGPEAIQNYLAAEAKGMRATPLRADAVELEDGKRQVVVKGRVKALVFMVNVQWTFILSQENNILDAHIKLLASLQELMDINRSGQAKAGD